MEVRTGRASDTALHLLDEQEGSMLMRFSDEFIDAMLAENVNLRRLGDEDKAARDK